SEPEWNIVLTGDFNGDGNDDLVWYNANLGATSVWLMSGTNPIGTSLILIDANTKPWAIGDFNGDHKADLLWFNASSGDTSLWVMNGTNPYTISTVLRDTNWSVFPNNVAATISGTELNPGNYGNLNPPAPPALPPPPPLVPPAPPTGKTFYIDW